MISYRSFSFTAGILAILSYLTFTVLALARYPHTYSPTANWLSDLGNPSLNPGGALFYDLGVLATGVLLVPFFLGLTSWTMVANRRQRRLVLLTQGLGILGAVALILSGLFPETFPALHGPLSAVLFILLGTAFAFSVTAIRYVPTCPRWLLALGAITAVADIIYGVFNSVRPFEWVTTALFLCYVCSLGVQTSQLERRDWKAGRR
jgi:hypothetical membrane protein